MRQGPSLPRQADFLPSSYGFRPGLSAHHALETIRQTVTWRGKRWVLDADIRSCLESSSHCRSTHGGGVEEGGFGVWDQYSQAFSSSVADVDGLQLAALDTLQHGLAGNAERDGGFEHRQPAFGGFFDEPWRSWSLTRIRQGAPGVSCSPAMNPSLSQRWMVDGATPRISAAREIGTGSPSGVSVGRWWRGMFQEPRRPETIGR